MCDLVALVVLTLREWLIDRWLDWRVFWASQTRPFPWLLVLLLPALLLYARTAG